MQSEPTTAPGAKEWATRFGIKAYRYRNHLKKRWWILAVAVSLGLACEAWILVRQPVTYLSTGNLLVGGTLDVGNSGAKLNEEQDGFNQTQIKILQSEDLQDSAKRSLAIIAPQLNGTIEVIPGVVPRTNIFSIAGYGSNPEYTQRFVDTLMSEYIKNRKEEQASMGTNRAQGITTELEAVRTKLDKERADLQSFKEANNMAFWTEQQKASVDMLTNLKKQQAAKMTELQQLQNMTNDQILNRSVGTTSTPIPKAVAVDDPQATVSAQSATTSDLSMQYYQASQDLSQKQAELDEKSKVWKPKHPGITAIKGEIERIQRQIKNILKQNQQTTQARIESLKAELKGLDDSIEIWNKKVMEASRMDSKYQTYLSAVTTTQSYYDKLVQSIQSLTNIGGSGEHISIMGTGASIAKRVPPGVMKHLITGFVLGLLAGSVVFYVIDRADDRIASSSEMIEYFSEPILGQIPDINASRKEAGLPLLQHDDERYAFAESLRSLRSSLIFMPNQGELKTLIITSSIPGEGKSTIASNLGITMALAGARVLLVDCDLRRGDLASLFDVDGRIGFSSVLRGEVEWRNALQKTPVPTLTLLPRGPVTNQSGELLLVPAFEPMLQDFKDNYDLTIFNTSPILATDDTATIAPHFDGTLMVIRAQFTGAKLARNSMNALYQRQVNVLGLILNCVDTEMPDYYYYRYKNYYAATE